MTYKLKRGQESFTAVDGPFAGRTFCPGKIYAAVPPGEERRFERVRDAAPVPDPDTARTAKSAKKSAENAENSEVKS